MGRAVLNCQRRDYNESNKSQKHKGNFEKQYRSPVGSLVCRFTCRNSILFQYKGKKIRKNNVILFYIVRDYTRTKVFYDNFVLTIFTFMT